MLLGGMSFCTGFQVGHCLQSSRTGQRQVTQLVGSLIIDCLLSALQPQLARVQHIKEDFPAFTSKEKLQRAEKDSQSSRSTSEATSPSLHQPRGKAKRTVKSQ